MDGRFFFFVYFLGGLGGRVSFFSFFDLLLALELTPVAELISVIGAEVPVAPDVELMAGEKREEKMSREKNGAQ